MRAARQAQPLHRFLNEHYAGDFPLCLAPDQMRALTIGAEDDSASAPLVKYAKDIVNELRGQIVRVNTNFRTNPIEAKIKDAEQLCAHRPAAELVVSVRLDGNSPQDAKPKVEVVSDTVLPRDRLAR